MENEALKMLLRRGIDLDSVAELVLEMQKPYIPSLTLEECRESVTHVLMKREVQYAVITGVTLDEMAEEGTLEEPFGSIVREDDRLFSIDEILALSIINVYGSIGLSNFGYINMTKPGCLGLLGQRVGVSTFLDDIVAALVAAACARIAHNAES